MTQQKIEVIIFAGDQILIQDVTLHIQPWQEPFNPILRMPSLEQLEKTIQLCQNTINSILKGENKA